jgi:hypothetical protein
VVAALVVIVVVSSLVLFSVVKALFIKMPVPPSVDDVDVDVTNKLLVIANFSLLFNF